jgi:hypothetical protein
MMNIQRKEQSRFNIKGIPKALSMALKTVDRSMIFQNWGFHLQGITGNDDEPVNIIG